MTTRKQDEVDKEATKTEQEEALEGGEEAGRDGCAWEPS